MYDTSLSNMEVALKTRHAICWCYIHTINRNLWPTNGSSQYAEDCKAYVILLWVQWPESILVCHISFVSVHMDCNARTQSCRLFGKLIRSRRLGSDKFHTWIMLSHYPLLAHLQPSISFGKDRANNFLSLCPLSRMHLTFLLSHSPKWALISYCLGIISHQSFSSY